MSQQSKPAAYLKAAAKALRLQRTLSRSKSSKSKDLAASAAMSAPCSPATPTFQHSNGRRLSYSQYIQHPQSAYSIQLHTPHHQHDTPLYSLQRRRNNSSSTSRQRSCSPSSSRPAAVDSTLFSKGASSSKLSRRSGPPVNFPVITIHHMQPDHSSCNGTYVTLTRSKSMPLRRRKRFSHQPPTAPMPSLAPVVSHSQWCTSGPVPVPTQHLQHHTLGTMSPTKHDTTPAQGTGLSEVTAAAINRPDTGGLEQLVLDLDLCVPGPTVSDTQSRSSASTTAATVSAGAAAPVPGIGHILNRTGSGQNMAIAYAMAKPSRSLTGSSLISNKSTQSAMSMPLADSSMSIQSHLSEASMLSAAMSASGLPSMDVMMDQVDRSIAADQQAQLVENAHVSVPHVTYVNRSMLAEPCSAKVETWVS